MTDSTPVEIDEIVDRIIEIRLADGAILQPSGRRFSR